jgi:hypothetical protein
MEPLISSGRILIKIKTPEKHSTQPQEETENSPSIPSEPPGQVASDCSKKVVDAKEQSSTVTKSGGAKKRRSIRKSFGFGGGHPWRKRFVHKCAWYVMRIV